MMTLDSDAIRLFAPSETHSFGERVAEHLGLRLSHLKERSFSDGEHSIRPEVSVRERDVFVIQSLYEDARLSVNDKLCRLLFLLGGLREASARRITAVIPYLSYTRLDRRAHLRDPVTTSYVAQMLEAVGVDRVMTMDVHNLAAYENAFRCSVDHLEAQYLFARYFADRLKDREIVVTSPDVGGVKRADQFARILRRVLGRDVPTAFVEKLRREDGLEGGRLVGRVEGRTVIVIDDLISTGGTIRRAAEACQHQGAAAVYVAATHGLFVGDAARNVEHPAIEKVVLTNSVPPFRLSGDAAEKLDVLDASELFATAIRCVHEGSSMAEAMQARVDA